MAELMVRRFCNRFFTSAWLARKACSCWRSFFCICERWFCSPRMVALA